MLFFCFATMACPSLVNLISNSSGVAVMGGVIAVHLPC